MKYKVHIMEERGKVQKEKNIANLSLEIKADALKEIVESGKLAEFVESASALAAEQIRAQLFEELGKMALSASEKGRALQANMVLLNFGYYDSDNKYGTRCTSPFCITRCIGPWAYANLASEISSGVQLGMTEYAMRKK